MTELNCIFCKIAQGEIPSRTIYEDESFRVIFDIEPASKGHAIIIPKTHASDIFSLSEEEAKKVFLVAKKVATVLVKELKCDGINILQNNGEAAGQTVFHFHIHLIPRYNKDSVHISWLKTELDEPFLDSLSEKIRDILK